MATLAPYTFLQYFDNNGAPLNGGLVYTYDAGTTTPKATYTDETEDTANANPVVLDANGRADIWLGAGNYKLELRTSADVLIKTVDNVAGQSTGGVVSYDITTNTSITELYDRANIYVNGTVTLSLLPVADAGDGFEFWVFNIGSNNVTIDPDASETINDAATLTLLPDEWAKISCDGDEWYAFVKDKIIGLNNTFTGDNTFSGTTTFSGATNVTGDATFSGDVRFPDDGELTIATGAITVTGANHTVDTESDSASDDLDTINGHNNGQILYLRAENAARTVVVKDGTGNIETPDGQDITLDETEKQIALLYDTALTKWLVVSQPPSTSEKFLHIQDQKASGNAGGTFTSGSWQTRTLNTEVTDEIGSTLSSNQFTLPAGTYYIEALLSAYQVANHKAKLYNATDTADVIIGTNGHTSSSNNVISWSHVNGRFTIAAQKTFELQHRCQTSKATDGYGLANSFSVVEIYADVKIWQIL